MYSEGLTGVCSTGDVLRIKRLTCSNFDLFAVVQQIADASGIPVTYRKAELRFRLWASYRDLGEYLKEIESMDQLVVVRSVGVQYEAANYPDLVSDVAIWLYGTP